MKASTTARAVPCASRRSDSVGIAARRGWSGSARCSKLRKRDGQVLLRWSPQQPWALDRDRSHVGRLCFGAEAVVMALELQGP
jgi:hypothetical protein